MYLQPARRARNSTEIQGPNSSGGTAKNDLLFAAVQDMEAVQLMQAV
jgi:hypothetical protein